MSFSILPTLHNNHRSTQTRQQSTTEALSTGKRINSYADDAAGAAISYRMNARAVGLEVARRNVSDGLSLATTTDAGLGDVSSMLEGIRELSVRAANGTFSDSDREIMQKELETAVNEINRFAASIKWNDISILAGTAEGLIGNRYDTYFADNMASLSGVPTNATVDLNTLNPSLVGPENQTATWVYTGFFVPDQSGVWEFRTTSDDASYMWLGAEAQLPDASNDVGNALVSNPGTHPMVTSTSGSINLVAGTSYPIKVVVGNNTGPMGLNVEYRFGSAGNFINDIGLFRAVSDALTIQSGEDAHDSVELNLRGFALASSLQMSGLSIQTSEGARSVIDVVDKAIQTISGQRAAVGASVNRLMSEENTILSEQLAMRETARKIEDADIAEYAAEQAVSQIMTESGLKAIEGALSMNRIRILSLLEK